MIHSPSISIGLEAEYQKQDTETRLRRYKIACLLSLFATASGVTLDYLVYPQHLVSLVWIRVAAVFLVSILFGIHKTEFCKRNIMTLTLVWALTISLSICAMVFATGGATSPYYAGLNLVILAAGVLLPWTFKETVFVCISTLVLYVAACIFYALASGVTLNGALLFNNCFFIFMTSVISATSSYFNTLARIKDFNLRNELDARNKELEDMDRLKSQFFANVSHELRTPLTLILSPIQDLLRRPELLSDSVAEMMRLARDNALRLLKLVNDLLEVIKLEEGKTQLQPEPIDLNSFLAGICDSMLHLAEPRHIDFRKDLAKEKIIAYADTYALERIFLNLLSNAIKFTPKGGSITITSAIDAERRAAVSIADTGIGISQKDLPYIFERFRQADGSSTRRYQGSGLGLALVKDLTEKLGGTILAESQPEVGTLMRVTLPLASAEQIDQPTTDRTVETDDLLTNIHRSAEHSAALPTSSPFEQLESSPPRGSKPTLLIVEDEPDMRQYLARMLETDYRVFQAREGPKALELARKHHPDLMVLDLMLPEIDGLEVCRRLKEDAATRDIKIILLTARIDESAKITALENGADDFLTKPFSRTEVITRLSNLLDTAKLESTLRQRNDELESALAELKQAQTNLLQSEKLNALGSLTAGLLHEINNPLNYVGTAIQLARIEPAVAENPDLEEFLTDIDEGVERVRNIVSDLHTFAHPSELDKQKAFSVTSAVESAIRFTSYDCKEIIIEQEVDPDHAALGSLSHIVQVLVNVVGNAARAINQTTDGRKGSIKIRSEIRDDRVHLHIKDNGVGMSDEVMKRIFDPFYTTQEVGKGMGLGLSICHTIVKNHGGALSARSVLGEGSEFSFSLPLAPENAEAAGSVPGRSMAVRTSNG